MDKFEMELKKAKNPWIVKIGNYLLSREDIKGNLKKEKKSLDECFTYIINELAKKAKESQQGRVGFASGEDEELYALAVHYYDEDDIKVVRGSYQTNADGSATYSQLQSKMEQNVPKSKKTVAKAQQKDEKVVKSESNEEEINKKIDEAVEKALDSYKKEQIEARKAKAKAKKEKKAKIAYDQLDIFGELGDESV